MTLVLSPAKLTNELMTFVGYDVNLLVPPALCKPLTEGEIVGDIGVL